MRCVEFVQFCKVLQSNQRIFVQVSLLCGVSKQNYVGCVTLVIQSQFRAIARLSWTSHYQTKPKTPEQLLSWQAERDTPKPRPDGAGQESRKAPRTRRPYTVVTRLLVQSSRNLSTPADCFSTQETYCLAFWKFGPISSFCLMVCILFKNHWRLFK